MKFKIIAGLLASSGLMSSCITNGDYFKSETAWIRENSTKKADVQMILGTPYAVGNSQGKPTWTYGYYRYKLFGKSIQKELKLYWNPDDTVSYFSFTSSFPEDTGIAERNAPPDSQPKY